MPFLLLAKWQNCQIGKNVMSTNRGFLSPDGSYKSPHTIRFFQSCPPIPYFILLLQFTFNYKDDGWFSKSFEKIILKGKICIYGVACITLVIKIIVSVMVDFLGSFPIPAHCVWVLKSFLPPKCQTLYLFLFFSLEMQTF